MLNIDKQVISILEKCRNLNHLKQLQSCLITLGHSQTQFLSFKLVRFCILSLSNLDYARLIFESVYSPNVYLYTAMITAYASKPQYQNSTLVLYRDMIRRGGEEGEKPNHFIFPHVLKCCSEISETLGTKCLHTQILKLGFGGYPVVQTALIDSYMKCSSNVLIARQVFDEMSERNVFAWTAMVSGYARFGEIGNAVCLFEKMPERDVPSWNSVIAGFTQNGLFLEAISFFRRMMGVGENGNTDNEIRPNQVTVACVLSACGNLGMLHLGRWIHGYIYRNKITINSYSVNALLDMYGKCGNLKVARQVFDQTSEKSLTLWNSMINCLALHGQDENAIGVFEEMITRGGAVRPDGVTFVGLLNACTHGGLVEQGYEYFNMMTRDYNIEPEIQHYGCVVDLLGRAGRLEEAMEVINGMKIQTDEIIWGSMLNSSKVHKRMDFMEFSIQRLNEISPSNAAYGIILANTYGEVGNWDEVRRVRKFMTEQGVKKTPGCSWIEIDKHVREFYSGDKTHPEEIYKTLDSLVCCSSFQNAVVS
ncbi:Pentatricopeptide repeat-containing protein [Thalictrum thalictroides]|uniref:Pentatricopeptide repeat-containing protein n=1 Tax=Thalictrum thalictroides TaxID=46969 RepID=A0A7J6WJ88_THATH|nr:Pentatricopeptide repeat-containing protein [Thalictrum thalictroides]